MVGNYRFCRQKHVKKIVIGLLTMAVCFVMLPFVAGHGSEVAFAGGSGSIVMEVSSKRILGGSGYDLELPMASTTKAMTALIIIERCNLKDIVTVPKEAQGIEGSSIYLRTGEKLAVEELLYGLMLRSGNDAAVALAIHCAGSVDRFAALMNEKAEALGLKHTHFVNPHGLHHPDHYTSAYDLAVIASEAMQNPDFAKIVGTKAIRITGSEAAGERYLVNKNKILTQYPGGNGVKTGYTTDAGRCLIAASVRDGMQVVAVVLNKYDMWEACSRLMDSAHENYQMQEVLSENEILAEASCDEKLKPASVALMAKSGFRYPLKKDGSESVSIVTKGVCGIVKPMPRGSDNGIAEIYFDNRLIFSTKLITMDMVEKKGFWERMFPSASDETQ